MTNEEVGVSHATTDARNFAMSDTIYGEILRQLEDTSDSIGKDTFEYGLQIRDFVLLSTVCDQENMTVGQLTELLGIERSILNRSLKRLERGGLLSLRGGVDVKSAAQATREGISIAGRFDHAATMHDEL